MGKPQVCCPKYSCSYYSCCCCCCCCCSSPALPSSSSPSPSQLPPISACEYCCDLCLVALCGNYIDFTLGCYCVPLIQVPTTLYRLLSPQNKSSRSIFDTSKNNLICIPYGCMNHLYCLPYFLYHMTDVGNYNRRELHDAVWCATDIREGGIYPIMRDIKREIG